MKIKYFIFSVIFVFFECFSIVCYAEVAPDIQKIITRGKLIVAICSQDYPPFFFHNSKYELEGFDIELAKEIAESLNVKLEFNSNAHSFNDVVKEVENDNADVGLSALSATLARGLEVSLSHPYLKVNKVLVINRVLDLKLETNESLVKKDQLKFAVIKNSAYETFLKKRFYTISKYADPNRVVLYNTSEEAMKDLMDGKIYALFTDEIKANFLLKKLRSANIYTKKLIIEGQTDPMSIAINWKNQNLRNWINLVVSNIQDDGTKEIFAHKYLKGFK